MDYTIKEALDQYSHEDKLLVQDISLSETEIFGEHDTILIAKDGLKRPNLICDQETKQKRFRSLTHVM